MTGMSATSKTKWYNSSSYGPHQVLYDNNNYHRSDYNKSNDHLILNFGPPRDIAKIVIKTQHACYWNKKTSFLTLSDGSTITLPISYNDVVSNLITLLIPGGTRSDACDNTTSTLKTYARTCTDGSLYVPGQSINDPNLCDPTDADYLAGFGTSMEVPESCPPCGLDDPAAVWTGSNPNECTRYAIGDYRVQMTRTDVDNTQCDDSVLTKWGPAGECDVSCNVNLDTYLNVPIGFEECSGQPGASVGPGDNPYTCPIPDPPTKTFTITKTGNDYFISISGYYSYTGPFPLVCDTNTWYASLSPNLKVELTMAEVNGANYLVYEMFYEYSDGSRQPRFNQIVDPAYTHTATVCGFQIPQSYLNIWSNSFYTQYGDNYKAYLTAGSDDHTYTLRLQYTEYGETDDEWYNPNTITLYCDPDDTSKYISFRGYSKYELTWDNALQKLHFKAYNPVSNFVQFDHDLPYAGTHPPYYSSEFFTEYGTGEAAYIDGAYPTGETAVCRPTGVMYASGAYSGFNSNGDCYIEALDRNVNPENQYYTGNNVNDVITHIQRRSGSNNACFTWDCDLPVDDKAIVTNTEHSFAGSMNYNVFSVNNS